MIERKDAEAYLAAYNQKHGTEYTLGELVGTGGTAAVYALENGEEPQVIKMMSTSVFCSGNELPALRRRRCGDMYRHYAEEIQGMYLLKGGPNVMPILGDHVHHFRDEQDVPEEKRSWEAVFMIVMPRLEPMKKFLEQQPLTEETCITIAKDICACLAHCEEKGIAHRDIKPQNIFILHTEEGPRFILGDFGICRLQSKPIPASGLTRVQTTGYSAPELAADPYKPVKSYSDIYSLGATLYELMGSGTLPIDYYDPKAKTCTPPALTEISPALSGIILKACEHRYQHRYQNAAEMTAALEALCPAQPEPEEDGADPYQAAREALRRNDVRQAAEYALRGKQKGIFRCETLLVYCNYLMLKKEREQLMELQDRTEGQLDRLCRCGEEMDELCLSLNELIFEENDAIARCIRALIYMEQGDAERFYHDIGEAAKDGYAMAQYYYGKALYEGWKQPRRSRSEGCVHLVAAAEAGYPFAVAYIQKKLYPLEPEFSLSLELERKVVLEPLPDKETMRAGIVDFL